MDWIRYFDIYIVSRTNGIYRLLILDGYDSYYSEEFENYYKDVMTQAITLGRGSLRQPRQANHYRRSLRGSRTSKVGPEDPTFGSTGPAQDPGLRTPGPRVLASIV